MRRMCLLLSALALSFACEPRSQQSSSGWPPGQPPPGQPPMGQNLGQAPAYPAPPAATTPATAPAPAPVATAPTATEVASETPAASASAPPAGSAPPPAASASAGGELPPGGMGQRQAGQPCSVHKDCESNVCEGEGCGFNAGRCVPKDRMCTRDLVAYCGCDGKTFNASGSCAGRVYKHKGACK